MILIKILIVIATFLFMEFVAWFTHKYVMHGLLWSWHRSHHRHHGHFLERNDLFAAVFAIPAIALIAIGTYVTGYGLLLYVGIGVTGYGVFYSIFHDLIVHRRIKFSYRPKSRYMKRIMNAHYVHHAKHSKEDCEAFGFLIAPKKYDRPDLQVKQKEEETY